MNLDEFKFPKTPHLTERAANEEDVVLIDKALKEFLTSYVKVQEKVDGSNITIYVDEQEAVFKHRGRKVDVLSKEFKNLDNWYKMHQIELGKICDERYLLCGEWMFWKHTVPYAKLPTFFIAYDMFDMENEKFLSQKKVAEKLKNTSIYQSPIIWEGVVGELKNLESLMNESIFGAPKKEGVYLRIDGEEYNISRAKHVSQEFMDSIKEHWLPLSSNKSVDDIEKYWQA